MKATQEKSCKICHSLLVKDSSFFTFERRTGRAFKVSLCSSCSSGWTDVPKDFDLSSFYPQEYYGQSNARFFPLMEKMVQFFRNRRAKFVEKFSNVKAGTILDIGCGRGDFLSTMADRSWNCCGTEFSETSSRKAASNKKIQISVGQSLRSSVLPISQFDVVTMWHSLEHLPDPDKAISTLKDVLKPGGVVIIEVPNFRSWQARIRRKSWIYLEAPRHLFHFSEEGLMKMLEPLKLKIVESSTWSCEFGIYGMMQELLNCITPRKKFSLSFDSKVRERKIE